MEALLDRIGRADADYVQIRERDLPARTLLELTRAALTRTRGRILVNDRTDIALAAGAHGVHLRSNPVPPDEVRKIVPASFLIAVSCHTVDDVRRAQAADFVVFGPVFDTPGKGPPAGIDGLARAVEASKIPVLALGGVTSRNADECIRAGAAGIAAIRMFQT
jgi:thiamine-phosphate pyrophosphorylase